MGDYENVIYLAFALAVVIISIVLMHIITSSKKLGSHPHRLPLYCCVVFVAGVASLGLIAYTSGQSALLDGFEPFALDDVSSAATLMEKPLSGADADVDEFSLAFYDGQFLNIVYNVVDGNSEQQIQVTGFGQCYPGEKLAHAPGSFDAVPLHLLKDAVQALDESDWNELFALPESGPVLLGYSGTLAPDHMGTAGQNVGYALTDGSLVPLDRLDAALAALPMPVLTYTSDVSEGLIFLADAL